MRRRRILRRREKFYIFIITIILLSSTLLLNFQLSIKDDKSNISTKDSPWHIATKIDYNRSMEKIAQYRSDTYDNDEKYRWLFLTSMIQYRTMMDRNFFSQFYAAQRHPNIESILWGTEFPGFDSSRTIIDNIRIRFGSPDYFHVIYEFGGGFGSKDVRLASRYSPIMAREHECWGYRCLPGIIDHNITIMLHMYAYEIDLYHRSFSYNRVMIHSPASAEPLVFYSPLALKTDTPPVRDIDLLVVGARDDFVYPLRTRLGEMVRKGLIKNSHLQAHPGYRFSNNTLEMTEGQMHSYAALLRRSKIVIVDSARYGYAIGKYMEVALSGCLIIGDIPAEREDEFRQFVVEISMQMTDEQIISIINYWIEHDEKRQIIASIGQQIALNSYTWDHSIDLSLQALIRYRQGEYGIYHRYPYSQKCVPLDNSFDKRATASKWCRSGLIGMPFRRLCECNESGINYMDDEPDFDHWRTAVVNIDASNPHMYLIPNGLLQYCDSYENIADYARRTTSGSVCRCQSPQKSWKDAKICYQSNSMLTIARHLAFQEMNEK